MENNILARIINKSRIRSSHDKSGIMAETFWQRHFGGDIFFYFGRDILVETFR